MAQLPPRAPSNWPHTRIPPPPSSSSSWADDFLDFASSRRGSHRRSSSDSIAFLEPSDVDVDCSRSPFDRFDDDQLMSLFSDELSPAPHLPNTSSTPSSPSDDDKTASPNLQPPPPKSELGEPDSSSDSILDPKRVKRILANRQSAQRSRVRKLQYISELERSVTSLQTEVSALSPRVAFLDHQRLILNVDNSALKQRIAALAQDKIFKDAHQEALKKEIERLRQIYHQQSFKKPETPAAPPSSDNMAFTEKQLIAS